MSQPVRNHNHLDFDAVQQCKVVHELSRFTPPNSGDFEPLESMFSRIDEIAEGMRIVADKAIYNKEVR